MALSIGFVPVKIPGEAGFLDDSGTESQVSGMLRKQEHRIAFHPQTISYFRKDVTALRMRAKGCRAHAEDASRHVKPVCANSLCLRCRLGCCMLNQMVHYTERTLDAAFAALADATRRGVLVQLCGGDASITHLADRFQMTRTGMKKHVGILEKAGLVTTSKEGRVRTCRLGPRRLEAETAWIERYRQNLDARFDALDELVRALKRKEHKT